jgi:arsenate reductase
LIREAGIEPEIIEYLKEPISADEVSDVLDIIGISPREAMRHKEAPYANNNLDDESLSSEELVAAMVNDPILIERPIVVTDKGACICRPPELVNDIL